MVDTEKSDASPVDGVAAEQDLPPHHGMSISEFVATRFTSLKPPMLSAPNPIRLVLMLNRRHWAYFSISFLAWVRRHSVSCIPPLPTLFLPTQTSD